MREELELLPDLLAAHLQLALVALAIGLVFSVPLGVYITRRPRLEPAVLGVAGVVQTIPSLALLAFMVALLGWMGPVTDRLFSASLPAIGYVPALIALTAYSVLPILQNTVTGVRGVDPALKEAARGVGMTDLEQLRRVELPQAMPVIVAGVRTATIWMIGMATLSTPIGAPSLGNYIFTGLQTRRYDVVAIGCVAAAALALILDGLIRWVERGFSERRRGLTLAGGIGVLSLYLYAGGAYVMQHVGAEEGVVRLGSKTFTEAYIMTAVFAEQIHEETGAPTVNVESLGSTVAFDALAKGQIDAYLDFSGTIWATIMKRTDVPKDPEQVLSAVKAYLAKEHDIELVAALGYENKYAFAMRADHAARLGVKTLGELIPHASTLELAGDYEFFGRQEWSSVQAAYGLSFLRRRKMDPALMYQAVSQGDVDVISAYSTDGRIQALSLTLLEDERHAIPPYHAIVLMNGASFRARPRVAAALGALSGALDEETVRGMNLAVDLRGESPAAVARRFLKEWRSGR